MWLMQLCLSMFVESEGLSLRVWWVIILDWIMDGGRMWFLGFFFPWFESLGYELPLVFLWPISL